MYGEVWVKGVYPGIDLRIDGSKGLKYDLVVAPGADPNSIRMRYDGQSELALRDGAMHVGLTTGNIVEEARVSFAERSGVQVVVVSADVPEYNTDGELLRPDDLEKGPGVGTAVGVGYEDGAKTDPQNPGM